MMNNLDDLFAKITEKIRKLEERMDFQERLEAAAGGARIVWLDPSVLSTQTSVSTGNVDFLFSAFSIPANSRYVLGIAEVILSGADPQESIWLQTVTTSFSQYIAAGVTDGYGTAVVASGIVFLPAYSTDRLRFFLSASSGSITAVDSAAFRAFGYVP